MFKIFGLSRKHPKQYHAYFIKDKNRGAVNYELVIAI